MAIEMLRKNLIRTKFNLNIRGYFKKNLLEQKLLEWRSEWKKK